MGSAYNHPFEDTGNQQEISGPQAEDKNSGQLASNRMCVLGLIPPTAISAVAARLQTRKALPVNCFGVFGLGTQLNCLGESLSRSAENFALCLGPQSEPLSQTELIVFGSGSQAAIVSDLPRQAPPSGSQS